ncbi:hypothetical protein GGX14DRAFT_383854 [Mycena pura]|uniref:Uncharacterized protein n=1 Tax=Mycena pura TaxID=153505 RepID=A0AAD6YUR6_9AGAR|nr:hypothetical protein GGX14DRAFT_383854 [Mycena pura]
MSPTPLRFAHYASPAPSSRSRLQAPRYPREGLSKPPRHPKPFASILKPSVSSVKPSASSSKSSPPPQALPLPKSSASSSKPSASPRLASLRHHKDHASSPPRDPLPSTTTRCMPSLQRPDACARRQAHTPPPTPSLRVACGPSPLGARAPCSLELPHAPPPTPSPRGSVWRETLPWTRSCPHPPRSSCVRMSSMHRGDGATVPLLERSAPTAVRAKFAAGVGSRCGEWLQMRKDAAQISIGEDAAWCTWAYKCPKYHSFPPSFTSLRAPIQIFRIGKGMGEVDRCEATEQIFERRRQALQVHRGEEWEEGRRCVPLYKDVDDPRARCQHLSCLVLRPVTSDIQRQMADSAMQESWLGSFGIQSSVGQGGVAPADDSWYRVGKADQTRQRRATRSSVGMDLGCLTAAVSKMFRSNSGGRTGSLVFRKNCVTVPKFSAAREIRLSSTPTFISFYRGVPSACTKSRLSRPRPTACFSSRPKCLKILLGRLACNLGKASIQAWVGPGCHTTTSRARRARDDTPSCSTTRGAVRASAGVTRRVYILATLVCMCTVRFCFPLFHLRLGAAPHGVRPVLAFDSPRAQLVILNAASFAAPRRGEHHLRRE